MITLTPTQLDTLLAEVRTELVAKIMAESRDAITLLSPAQAAGLLDINPQTLRGTDCPRVVLSPQVHKYRLADIISLIERNLEK
jgi:uroporphyrinogen-III synthase